MNERRIYSWIFLGFLTVATLSGCAARAPAVPYPAFVQLDERPGSFVAAFPGLRPQMLSSDARTGQAGYRLQVPAGWNWGTGAAPGMTVEIFILRGELRLADISLQAGGYAYLPSGSLGFTMHSENGAELLYFLDVPNRAAVIRTPLIISSDYLEWRPLAGHSGMSVGELRMDPGSGARTWLMRIDPHTDVAWQKASYNVEGYLISGDFKESECVAGKPVGGDYLPGGYFLRPAEMVHGSAGPATIGGATWLMRRLTGGDISEGLSCGKAR